MGDEGFELGVEGREIRMGGNGVEGGVVAVIALVFPDVYYDGYQLPIARQVI